MATQVSIKHIATTDLVNLGNNQMGYETVNDAVLGFPMWGGKDGSGNLTKWLAKDKNARVQALTVNSLVGPGSVTVDASGVFGVDTGGTYLKLDGTSIMTGAINTGAGNGITSTTSFPISLGTTATDDFTINATGFVYEGDTGNIGIGAAPSSGIKLDVNGDINSDSITTSSNNNFDGEKMFLGGNTYNPVINTKFSCRINIDSDNDSTTEKFVIGKNQDSLTTGNELLSILESGFVGVGEDDPKLYLQILDNGGLDGNINQQIFRSNSYNDGSSKRLKIGYVTEIVSDITDGSYRIYKSGTGPADSAITYSEVFTLLNNGNFGFGYNAPRARIDCVSDSATAYSAGAMQNYSTAVFSNLTNLGYTNLNLDCRDNLGNTGTACISAFAPTGLSGATIFTFGTKNSIGNTTEALRIDDSQNIFLGYYPGNKYTWINSTGLIEHIGADSGISHGNIYSTDNTTGISVTTSIWNKITDFDTDGFENGNITRSQSNDRLTGDTSGIYFVWCMMSVYGSTDPSIDICNFGIFKNGGSTTPESGMETGDHNMSDGEQKNVVLLGTVSLTAGDYIEVKAYPDNTGTLYTPDKNWGMFKISGI